MLKQRIITALAMLAVLLPALFADSPQAFLLLSAMLVSAGAWEWANMNGMNRMQSLASGLVCMGFCSASVGFEWTAHTHPVVWWVAGSAWVVITTWMLFRGVDGWAKWNRFLRWGLGVIMLWLAWLAMAQARTTSIQLLLSIFCVVWVADVCAYFFGRALGGKFVARKLAPVVSPGKSWEGVMGGLLGVFALASIWMQMEKHFDWPGDNLFSLLLTHGEILWVLSLVFLTMMSVVGDLVESLVKRSAGTKDSSRLLPGHGGVLDRLDALLPTLPIALMLLNWPSF
jgi:phosphatidate cytidylyltransferase